MGDLFIPSVAYRSETSGSFVTRLVNLFILHNHLTSRLQVYKM